MCESASTGRCPSKLVHVVLKYVNIYLPCIRLRTYTRVLRLRTYDFICVQFVYLHLSASTDARPLCVRTFACPPFAYVQMYACLAVFIRVRTRREEITTTAVTSAAAAAAAALAAS